ncbi:MAG: AAA family ATPase [Myxococcota bacterium]|nr:AAA family ATPase [Myxococcota bacterium]
MDVELAPLTVLVGRNGSGKSNFADALVFVRDLGMDASTSVSKRGGILGVRRWSRTKPFDVSITVRAAAQKSALESIFIEHSFTIASGRDGQWEFKRERIHGIGERHGTSKSATVKFLLARNGNKITESRPSFPVGELPSTTSAMLLGRQIWPPRTTEPLRAVRRYRLNPDEMRTPQKISGSLAVDVGRIGAANGCLS